MKTINPNSLNQQSLRMGKHRNYLAGKKWKERNHEKRNAQHRRTIERLRLEALHAYGRNFPICECCSESNPKFLTLSHPDGDGRIQRKSVVIGGKNKGGVAFYRALRRLGFPKNFRILIECFNCNIGATANGGVCPHKTVTLGIPNPGELKAKGNSPNLLPPAPAKED
ncbi:MAG TPA: hypothetical protein VGS11_10930 [Candidatus Bathyarchaeia archaeon]|nr:hypothetical protein [Candidatus Bathyarchaeia archaeon]